MAPRGRGPSSEKMARLGYVYGAPLVHEIGGERPGMRQALPMLNTKKERKIIRAMVSGSGREMAFRATVATPSNLRALLTDGCKMLHFSGHGEEGLLAFESDRDASCGTMEPLRVDSLKELFQAGGVSTELVCISSCSSELNGKAFVEAGVPHVVAVKVQEKLTDEAAYAFCKVFYHALLTTGKSVQDAFDIAVSAAKLSSPQEQGDIFLLLPSGGNHDVRIFDTLPAGSFVDDTSLLPPGFGLPRARNYCLGTLGLQRIVKQLVDPHATCVTVTGEPGSGKTEMALQASMYLQERHRFDAFFFVDCSAAVMTATSSAPPALGRSMSGPYADLCSLIGSEVEMPAAEFPSHKALRKHLFTNPTAFNEGRPPEKVLLILDAVDALYEGAESEKRDCVVNLLNDLCRFGEGQLRFLLTSEHRLLVENSRLFQNGSEKVSRVGALRGEDPARLLLYNIPRPLDCSKDLESGQGRFTFASILESLKTHSVLKAAQGHPETLVRLASMLNSEYLCDPKMEERALRYRKEYTLPSHERRRVTRVSSNTSSIASSTGAAGNAGGHDGTSGTSGADKVTFGGAVGCSFQRNTTSPIFPPWAAAYSAETVCNATGYSHGGMGHLPQQHTPSPVGSITSNSTHSRSPSFVYDNSMDHVPQQPASSPVGSIVSDSTHSRSPSFTHYHSMEHVPQQPASSPVGGTANSGTHNRTRDHVNHGAGEWRFHRSLIDSGNDSIHNGSTHHQFPSAQDLRAQGYDNGSIPPVGDRPDALPVHSPSFVNSDSNSSSHSYHSPRQQQPMQQSQHLQALAQNELVRSESPSPLSFEARRAVAVAEEAERSGSFTLRMPSFGSGINNSSNHNHHCPRQQHRRQQSPCQQAKAQNELEGSRPPCLMSDEARRAWDAAKTAGLIDRECCFAWLRATTDAAKSGWYERDGELPGFVPWPSLALGLQNHLCGSLAVVCDYIDGGPHGCNGASGAVGEWAEGLAEVGGVYGILDNAQPSRGMNAHELGFVKGKLREAGKKKGGARGGEGGHSGGDSVSGRGGLDGASRDIDRNVVSIEDFAIFCGWWGPLMTTLSRLQEDWVKTSPDVIIMGFVGKMEAESKLLASERGTFLLRFSESIPGGLVVSLTDSWCEAPSAAAPPRVTPRIVKHSIIDVHRGGRCSLRTNRPGVRTSYAGLHDLVLRSRKLRILYPDTPKQKVFVGLPGEPAGAPFNKEALGSSHIQDPVPSRVHRGISEGPSWLRTAPL